MRGRAVGPYLLNGHSDVTSIGKCGRTSKKLLSRRCCLCLRGQQIPRDIWLSTHDSPFVGEGHALWCAQVRSRLRPADHDGNDDA